MRLFDNCSILAGSAGPDDTALITVMNDGLAEERQQHAIPLLYRDGGWALAGEEKILPWLAAGIAGIHDRAAAFVIVGWAGQAVVVDGQNSRREAILRTDDHVSIVRSVARIGDATYAVGMRRQVHKRLGSGRWEEVDRGVVYHGAEPAIGFDAIDGFAGAEIYAAGLNGEIWYQEKGQWHEVHSPTNAHLHCLTCSPDRQVYVGGRSGIFMRGARDTWQLIDLETDETLWDLHHFGGELYMIIGNDIHHATEDKIEKIDNEVMSGGEFHRLSSQDGKLWAFGSKKIAQYDGSTWSELDCDLPDNIDTEVLSFFNNDVLTTGSRYLEDD